MNDQATVEFYEDALHTVMVGAVYMEKKRLAEGMKLVGRAICKARKLNVVECVILDGDGYKIDQAVVYRGR